jgi:hypothetical protein
MKALKILNNKTHWKINFFFKFCVASPASIHFTTRAGRGPDLVLKVLSDLWMWTAGDHLWRSFLDCNIDTLTQAKINFRIAKYLELRGQLICAWIRHGGTLHDSATFSSSATEVQLSSYSTMHSQLFVNVISTFHRQFLCVTWCKL